MLAHDKIIFLFGAHAVYIFSIRVSRDPRCDLKKRWTRLVPVLLLSKFHPPK